ncbi:glycosyltransferase family 2 protein [Larkinella humicola]|uniref:Glycosyltransferase family 2 protein n=1 Tax=Larkinella humicola TaxID=2607654 RepID=A0A5N1JGN0_9BACT|nr:glycosyltransferase family 2 protein [Larkinella humicola]KAA9353657.1 glycosyltransferase family 2 protein [Larkinella humicola]
MDEVAIVILNYNGKSFLEQFLPSVLTHSEGCPVYVADNHSTDGSLALLERKFPSVHLIRLAANFGYAGGYNAALTQINATYLLLLNSDVEVSSGWLAPLVQRMKANPRIAACQPKIRSFKHPRLFEYAGGAGGYIDYLGYPFCRGRVFDTVEEDQNQYDDAREIFWATGACLLVRSDVFLRLGGFDPRFFAHMEEIDWCWRAKNAGYQIWYVPESTVYHVGGGTLHKSNPRKTFLNYRNSLAMLYKNLPTGHVFLNILIRLVLDGISGVRLLLAGNWRDTLAILQAHFTFYSWLPYLRKQRNALADLRNNRITHPQIYPHSIIWQYFVKGRKTFAALLKDKK